MSSHTSEWTLLDHPSKEKELKIGGANKLLNIGKDGIFKTSVCKVAKFDSRGV